MEKEWFGSAFYNLLYSHRDPEEAKKFIENILKVISLPPNAEVWDMACGSGRHAIFLAKKNFIVTATDSVKLCIEEAEKTNSHPNIVYCIHNYMQPIHENRFNLVLNLFTSLGYTQQQNELENIFNSAYKSLKENGMFLIDFLNPHYVRKNLVPFETIVKNEIVFKITRSLRSDPSSVTKNIEVISDSEIYRFYEWVRLYETDDFLKAARNKFEPVHQWGDYDLNKWNIDSPRNILLFRKISL
jgi:2-polyprenyl-3-methyl-5-hydroxy-6-metoxy-1,4-benzoquinol methylase